MDAIRRYVITLTAAAMLCALVKAIAAGRKGQQRNAAVRPKAAHRFGGRLRELNLS